MDNFPDLFWLENAPGQLRSLVAGVVRGAFEDVGWNLCLKRGGGFARHNCQRKRRDRSVLGRGNEQEPRRGGRVGRPASDAEKQRADTMAWAQDLGGSARSCREGHTLPFGINQQVQGPSFFFLQTRRPSILSIFRWMHSGRKEQGLAPVLGELTSWPSIA